MFVVIKSDVIHAYLCCNIVPLQRKLMAIASQIKEMSGKSASVNDNANVFNKTIVFLVNKGDDHVIEELS